ncbi:hypothetical protein NB311A_20066 [Nitrobacter sp. Nb-311A]|nr:hypothetical protein NB311A_20066 [Nitrobacter sp. Nb-311A]
MYRELADRLAFDAAIWTDKGQRCLWVRFCNLSKSAKDEIGAFQQVEPTDKKKRMLFARIHAPPFRWNVDRIGKNSIRDLGSISFRDGIPNVP